MAIHTKGLDGELRSDPALNALRVNDNQLLVPETDKLAVMRKLLSYDHISDLHIEPANLEQLYQYYLNDGSTPISNEPEASNESEAFSKPEAFDKSEALRS